MCTAIFLKSNNRHIFGRNLDVEEDIKDRKVIITPRNYPLIFKKENIINNHYAFLGMAIDVNNTPLYFDGMNEYGLCIASLNFPIYGCLNDVKDNHINLSSYEIISYVLAKFKTVDEVKNNLSNLNITNIDFNIYLKSVSLHYLISDKDKSIVIEQTVDGVKIYDNLFNILTNAPEFSYHVRNINSYLNFNNKYPVNNFKNIDLKPYCVGDNMIGIPGDYSSNSRFIKGAYLINNAIYDDEDILFCHQHILENLKMVKGIATSSDGRAEYTAYSASFDQDNLIYYFKNYNSLSYEFVNLNKIDNLDDVNLIFG